MPLGRGIFLHEFNVDSVLTYYDDVQNFAAFKMFNHTYMPNREATKTRVSYIYYVYTIKIMFKPSIRGLCVNGILNKHEIFAMGTKRDTHCYKQRNILYYRHPIDAGAFTASVYHCVCEGEQNSTTTTTMIKICIGYK